MVERWEADAGLMTIGEAVAAALRTQEEDGTESPISAEEWTSFAKTASFWSVREKARELGIDFHWDAELARTPEGFYQVRGGLSTRSPSRSRVAPYADIIWMETASADIHEAHEFAEAIHAEFPDQLLAYNLSPSFNWDSTGMSDDEMRAFPERLGRGRLRVQLHHLRRAPDRRCRRRGVLHGPAPRRHAGAGAGAAQNPSARVPVPHPADPRRRAAPRRRPRGFLGPHGHDQGDGQGLDPGPAPQSTPSCPRRCSRTGWPIWSQVNGIDEQLRVRLQPSREGTDVIELSILGADGEKRADVVFAPIHDRKGRTILSVRDQNTFDDSLRRKRLQTLIHLYLFSRYQVDSVHYVAPTDDNAAQCERMKAWGIYTTVSNEVGAIIVAQVDQTAVAAFTEPDAIANLIHGEETAGTAA